MTIEELGQSVKQKYPQYQNLPDADVGQRILERYPQYQSRITTPEAVAPEGQSTLGKIGDFAAGVYKSTVRPFATPFAGFAAGVTGHDVQLPGWLGDAKGSVDPSKQARIAGGAALEAATLLPAGKAFGAAAASKKLLPAIGKNIVLGSTAGALGAAGNKMSTDNGSSFSDVLKEGAKGAVVGGAVGTALPVAGTLLGSVLKKPIKSVDALIRESDAIMSKSKQAVENGTSKATGELLSEAEAQAPSLTLREKWAGVRPDIKKQIQGKQDQLKSYFDIAHARNLDVNLPTPLEFAKERASKAADKAASLLQETGTKLGKFREKINTYKVPVPDIQSVVDDFDTELRKLNLDVKNGKIVRQAGRVVKTSEREMSLLQGARDNLDKWRESPSIATGLENRMALDNSINFAKSAREVSGVVDPIARKIRSRIAEINRKTVGALEAGTLRDYSDLASFVDEFNSYMSRDAGGEYLLKRVLSERGGETRALMQTLKKYTGTDLLDDATMAQIATDLIGNSAQKGLFRQEISKAGLDALQALSGDKLGAVLMLLNKGKSAVAPAEKMFLKAASRK